MYVHTVWERVEIDKCFITRATILGDLTTLSNLNNRANLTNRKNPPCRTSKHHQGKILIKSMKNQEVK